MLHGRDIIVLALPRWDGKYESTSFNISLELAKHNRVLYVDNPFTITEIMRNISSAQIKRRLRKFLPFSTGLSSYQKDGVMINLLTVPPILTNNFLPAGKLYDVLSRINHWLVGTRIKRAIRALGMNDYVFINSFNFFYPDLGNYLNPSLFIYHCVDAISKMYIARHGLSLEQRLLHQADMVISTAKKLQAEKAKVNPHSYYVPNAADFSHSSKAVLKSTKIAVELSALNKPIIGYFGNIEVRIDYDLLRTVFGKHPEWTLAMVGPVMREYIPEWFEKIPNVKMLGRQPYARMPEFLKGFDVAIIPFKVHQHSDTIYPLKLFEYLGAGKPVVCTPFNPDVLHEIEEVLYLGKTAEELEQAIVKALDENSQTKIKQRLAIARQNTWEARGKEFATIIEKWINREALTNGISREDKTKPISQKVIAKNYI